MASDEPSRSDRSSLDENLPNDVGRLVREAFVATLSTLDQGTGHPYASLVEVATTPNGKPILLLSRLARHTRNLGADARSSLLFDSRTFTDNPMAASRVTLVGTIEIASEASIGARFLRRHPGARLYADFADFAFWHVRPSSAHFVGGFGRITELAAAELWPPSGVDSGFEAAVAAAEARLLSEIEVRCEAAGSPWRPTGIDAGGLDVVDRSGGQRRAMRLNFEARAAVIEDVARSAERAVARLAAGSPASR